MRFINKLKARKKRKRLDKRKQKNVNRGSQYSDKIKQKVFFIYNIKAEKRKKEKLKKRRWGGN